MGTSVWVIGIFRSHGSCKGPHGLIIQFPWTYFSIMIIIKLLPSLLMSVALCSVCNFYTNVGKWQVTNDLRLTSKVKPLPILATLPTVLQPSNLEISRSKVPQKIFKPPTFLKKKTKLQRVCLASRWWITNFGPASYICNLYLRDLIGRRAKFLTAGLAAVANGHIFQLDQVLRRFLVMKLTSGSRVSCVSLSQFICSRSAEANGAPEQQHFFSPNWSRKCSTPTLNSQVLMLIGPSKWQQSCINVCLWITVMDCLSIPRCWNLIYKHILF